MLLFATLAAAWAAPDRPLDIEPWSLVRVEVPDWPGAESTSETGSVLLSPPVGAPWRPEPMAELDEYDAWEAVDAMAVQPWRDAGVDGTGVKVAIFDSQWYQAELWPDELGDFQTADCYAHRSCDQPIDTLRPRYSFEQGSHGVACAQVIHDIAPGAQLYLVRVNGQTSLENAVDWAIREGIDVVSMSLSFFGQSFYDGTGPINAPMDELAAADILMVKSAGNYAEEHWSERFYDEDGDGNHEFDRGSDVPLSELLPVYLNNGSNLIYLSWDQFDDCGRTDLDAVVIDASADIVGRSEDRQVSESDSDRTCEPVERVSATASYTGWHWLSVSLYSGNPDVNLDIFVRNGEVWRAKAAGSLTDPATHPDVLAVGAVRATSSYATSDAEYFSSVGPTNGGLDKPDIAGPDGLSTSIYGQTGFYGTSASTPAVAGAIALLLSDDPRLDPYEAAQRLRAAALSGDAVWQDADPWLGAGRARLPPPSSGVDDVGGCAGRAAMAPGLLWFSLRRRRTQRRAAA